MMHLIAINAYLLLFAFFGYKGPVGVAGLKGGRGTQGAPVSSNFNNIFYLLKLVESEDFIFASRAPLVSLGQLDELAHQAHL